MGVFHLHYTPQKLQFLYSYATRNYANLISSVKLCKYFYFHDCANMGAFQNVARDYCKCHAVNKEINCFPVFYCCVTDMDKRKREWIEAQAWPPHRIFATKLVLRRDKATSPFKRLLLRIYHFTRRMIDLCASQ